MTKYFANFLDQSEPVMPNNFQYKGQNVDEFIFLFSQFVEEEFYSGEFKCYPVDGIEVSAQKVISHPISLMRIISKTPSSFRRSWKDIRSHIHPVRVLWFVNRGTLRLDRSHGSCVVGAGECAILDASTPFYAQNTAPVGEVFDSIQAIVPSHLFFSCLPQAATFAAAFKTDAGGHHIISRMLELLFDEGEQLSSQAISPLIEAFLITVSDSLNGIIEFSDRRQHLLEERFATIEACILKNLTNPELCAADVAGQCGISLRYMSRILQSKNTSYGKLVWDHRLSKAQEWLCSERMQAYSINEIALNAGFKSSTHFSRAFKAAFGQPPAGFRRARRNG